MNPNHPLYTPALERELGMDLARMVESRIREAVAEERERCAKIVETYGLDNVATYNLVMMIRNPRAGSGSGSGPEEG